MNKDVIPVVFSTDQNYLLPTYIAAFSLVKNYRDRRELDLFIQIPGDYPVRFKNLFEMLPDEFDHLRCSIHFIDMGKEFCSAKINSDHISISTMYRLLLPDLLPDIEKCIYLDSDIVVEGNIAELYDINIGSCTVGGVKEWDIYKGTNNWKNILPIPSIDNYVNAGMLIMNLKAIRYQKLDAKLIEAGCHTEYKYNDQDAINVVCFSGIKLLPLQFNFRWSLVYRDRVKLYQVYGRQETETAFMNPCIVHYVGKNKPWGCKHMAEAKRWWKYLRQQKQIDDDYIKSFLKDHKAPWGRRFSEAIKNLILKSGIIKVYWWYERNV